MRWIVHRRPNGTINNEKKKKKKQKKKRLKLKGLLIAKMGSVCTPSAAQQAFPSFWRALGQEHPRVAPHFQ